MLTSAPHARRLKTHSIGRHSPCVRQFHEEEHSPGEDDRRARRGLPPDSPGMTIQYLADVAAERDERFRQVLLSDAFRAKAVDYVLDHGALGAAVQFRPADVGRGRDDGSCVAGRAAGLQRGGVRCTCMFVLGLSPSMPSRLTAEHPAGHAPGPVAGEFARTAYGRSSPVPVARSAVPAGPRSVLRSSAKRSRAGRTSGALSLFVRLACCPSTSNSRAGDRPCDEVAPASPGVQSIDSCLRRVAGAESGPWSVH